MPKKVIRRIEIPKNSTSTGFHLSISLQLPSVLAMGLVQVGPKWKQAPHHHDAGQFEIHFVRRGEGELLYSNRNIRVQAGDIFFIRPGEAHGCSFTEPTNPLQIFYMIVSFSPSIEAFFKKIKTDEPLFLSTDCVPELRSALKNLAEEILIFKTNQIAEVEIGVNPLIQSKILHVLGAMLAPKLSSNVLSGAPRERELSETVLRMIETSTKDIPTLSQLAKKLSVTKAYLGEVLRNTTGQTYPEIIANKRVNLAKELLLDADIPMREVARRVGLSSTRALARIFQRLTGKPPKAFRA